MSPYLFGCTLSNSRHRPIVLTLKPPDWQGTNYRPFRDHPSKKNQILSGRFRFGCLIRSFVFFFLFLQLKVKENQMFSIAFVFNNSEWRNFIWFVVSLSYVTLSRFIYLDSDLPLIWYKKKSIFFSVKFRFLSILSHTAATIFVSWPIYMGSEY